MKFSSILFYVLGFSLFIFVITKAYILKIDIKFIAASFSIYAFSQFVLIAANKIFFKDVPFKLLILAQAKESFLGFTKADEVKMRNMQNKNKYNYIIVYRLIFFSFWMILTMLFLPFLLYSKLYWDASNKIYYTAAFILFLSFAYKIYAYNNYIIKSIITMKSIFLLCFSLIVSALLQTLSLYYLVTQYLSTIPFTNILCIYSLAVFLSILFVSDGLGLREVIFSTISAKLYGSLCMFAYVIIIYRLYSYVFYGALFSSVYFKE